MKVFLDTNVIVSAVAARGLCADVFRSIIESHELVISNALILEVERVLRDKLGAPADLIAEVLELLRQDSRVASPDSDIRLPLSDHSDIQILSSALSGQAEIFITGDKEILDLKSVGSLAILTPRQFWERLRSR